ncbi:MAG: mannitol dehydrogenase family protein [Xanthobacteraceae bacterium]|jgi:fructuronate reductase|nr:mannitol dehydrogenase family protein [Xanthobacteraceae bacterium]MDF2809428.1 mannitol dehydrogenase family protein [Microvirga sp.]
MERLSPTTALPAHVQRPAYDRTALTPGIVHIGLGAFHRAHQAIYTDAALAAAFGPWGIVGVSLRSTDIVQEMHAQGGLYTVVTRDADGDSARVVGCVIDTLAATQERARLLALLADPAIRIVTMTVSEKAYGINPSTGGLDPAHPAVAADLVTPEAPTSVIGFLVEGLARRRAADLPPFTVLCCDNLPSNGRLVRRLVLDMAERRDASLAAWIGAKGSFPSSMVDRIVPAATEETRARATALLGAEDALALESEAFTQWVLEEDFVDGRPTWEAGGALFVADVEPYEKMKLRLLNGSHSLIAYLGQLRGLDYVRDVMAEPVHVARVRAHMEAAAASLDPLPGIDLAAYRAQLLARFANPAIAHRTTQIAMDGTQKLPQRIFAPAVEALARGGDADAFAYVTALWLAYVRRMGPVDDPRAAELATAASLAGSAPFFALPGLFPRELLSANGWRQRVEAHLATLDAAGR